MKARELIEAEGEGPKDMLRQHPEQGLAYRERPIDRDKDFGWNFVVGVPLQISFNVVARDMPEAVRLANAHFNRMMANGGIQLDDELDTIIGLSEHHYGVQLTDRNCMQWWELEGDGDPHINQEWTPELK